MELAYVYPHAAWARNPVSAHASSATCTALPPTKPVQTKRAAVHITNIEERKGHQEKNTAFTVVYHNDVGDPTSTSEVESQNLDEADLPYLVFIPGLDSRPLPRNQAKPLCKKYQIVSMCHERDDRSNWEELVHAAVPILEGIRKKSSHELVVIGESFGAALTMRLIPSLAPGVIKRLILINSGTAILDDTLLQTVTSLLPLLKIDRTGRVLYKAAAAFLFNVLLTREDRLDAANLPEDEWSILRSFDIDQVPLDTTIHRVELLKSFGKTFTDDCIRNLIPVPTVLVASGQDRLLRSRSEIDRLSKLLANVEKKVVLKESGHAALLERGVSLASILDLETPAQNSQKDVGGDNKRSQEAFQSAYRLGKQIFGPWRRITAPKIVGSENLKTAVFHLSRQISKQRPVLLVGNHTVFGILDLPLMYIEMYELLGGVGFRSLAHSAHFDQYGEITGGRWTNFVTDLGAVPAGARSYYKLLSAGERILLFPGGAREVCRRRGERYKLFWKEDVDFVRPAAKFDAVIVPFCAVGADDAVDILVDGQELQQFPLIGKQVRQMVTDNNFSPDTVMPIASFPPKGDRFYFKFQQPIDTSEIDYRDANACRQVYQQVRKSVEVGIEDLLQERRRDPKRTLRARILDGLLPKFDL